MNTYMSSHTLENTSKKSFFRPNSAAKRHLKTYKINTSLETPPPIIFTMPNNPKKLSGMGNKIEREQLYENNMQLKDIINKLKRELAETRNQVVKKDIEIRKKERIIKECSKENDLESVHELNLEKARESTLVSLCKDKYSQLKNLYTKKCEENEILKANIKMTKLKEYMIQIDILKKEMEKIKTLYENTVEDNSRLREEMSNFQNLKNKYIEQHSIINNLVEKCKQYKNDINELKAENSFLNLKLEKNMKQKKGLQRANFKLKISNEKFLSQKKIKENYDLNIDDNKKLISNLRKDLNEYKRLYDLKNKECNKLIENNEKMKSDEIKRKNEKDSLKPFDFNQIKVIENKNIDKNTNKLTLYKSLLDEAKHKNEIYELYLKKIGVDKDQLVKSFGYNGIMTSSTKIQKDENGNNNIENNNNRINEKNNDLNKNRENNEEIKKEENDRNSISDVNSYTKANTISENVKKLPSIEEEKPEEGQFIDESQLLSLLHVFVKNLEAQGITKEIINQKIQDISKLFENKDETTKEEFIDPFVKMFIETMKITQRKDIEIVTNFLNDFIDSLNSETLMFFNGLIEVFDNVRDYTGVKKDYEVSFELNEYKDQLINALKQNDRNNNHLITFDIFRKIVQDLNISLDDETMEYLIYLMKKNVPENNSIFDLDYEIIEKLTEKNEIGDIFKNIKNTLNDNKSNIDTECQEFLKSIEYEDLKFLIIKRDDFFSVLDKLEISMSDELKNSIYEVYKVEIETNDNSEQEFWMEYDRIRSELE